MKNLQNSVKEEFNKGWGGAMGVLETGHASPKPRCWRSLQAASCNCIMVQRTTLLRNLQAKFTWNVAGLRCLQGSDLTLKAVYAQSIH
jgi:hypothetical protein